MTAERAIQTAVFVLLLFGLGTLSAWASYTYIGELVLKIALIPLGWGIILLMLYLVFKKLGWHWWG